MPRYTYSCDSCHSVIEKFFSISEFIESKNKLICENCNGGLLSHKITTISALVEKSNDQIILDIQEEVQKTVNKINNGNQKAIEDVYGDRANPYKR